MKIKVCHITTVHPRTDTRIFIKECKSLAKYYEVHLIVADGKENNIVDKVHIHDIGLRQKSRIKRLRIDSDKALKKALSINCDIYHFHDPELISVGVKLKKAGKKVIYDVHEDLPRQVYSKPYLKNWIKPILSRIIEWQENKAAKKFDYIITATSHIRNRFFKINKNSIDINNYPVLGEFNSFNNWSLKQNQVCYIGGITEVRGIKEMVNSLEFNDAKLVLAGTFDDPNLETKMKYKKLWSKVEYLGFIDRHQISEVLKISKAGLVTLHPIINYMEALPVKMFEYMMAGLPVITSDIPLWKNIVESNKCGIAVNPLNPREISNAINYIMENPEKAEKMGENGQKAVKEKYNWSIEECKLFDVYNKVLKND